MTYERGDLISYQCAGMPKPRHGKVSNMARHVPNYVFIRFPNQSRDDLVPTQFTRPGHVKSWFVKKGDGKWHKNE